MSQTNSKKKIVVKGKNKEQPVLMPCSRVYN